MLVQSVRTYTHYFRGGGATAVYFKMIHRAPTSRKEEYPPDRSISQSAALTFVIPVVLTAVLCISFLFLPTATAASAFASLYRLDGVDWQRTQKTRQPVFFLDISGQQCVPPFVAASSLRLSGSKRSICSLFVRAMYCMYEALMLSPFVGILH